MNELQSEEKSRLRRQLAERAINLAMSGNWPEAVEVADPGLAGFLQALRDGRRPTTVTEVAPRNGPP